LTESNTGIDFGGEEPFEFTYDVPLTLSDRADRTDILCQLRDQREREDGILTSSKSIHKDRIAQIEVREREIFRELRRQQREVTALCVERKDFDQGVVQTVTLEEGTVVGERPMSEDERQMGLGESDRGVGDLGAEPGDTPEE
jgi:hypothetical protein